MVKEIKIKKHELVPVHEKLTEEEKKKVFQRFNVSMSQMPAILPTDPAIENLDVVPGDLIKITRNSPTAIKSVYYRVVVYG